MKKTLLIMATTMFAVNQVNAQLMANASTELNYTNTASTISMHQATRGDNDNSSKDDVPTFYIGVRVLGTISSFKVNTVESNNVSSATTTATLGYGGGVYFGFNISKHFAIQPEILYSTLSQKYKDKGIDRRIDVDYINIPLMFVFNTNITKPVNFNIAAGPQVGINVGAKVSSVSQGNTAVVNTKFAVKATDFGVAYGAGFDFRLVDFLTLGVGFRGVKGLVDISDKNSTATYTSTDNGVTTIQTVAVLDKSKVSSYGGYVGLRFNF